MQFDKLTYCWWFRNPAITSWYVGSPIICKVLYIPGGCLGFLPSTVAIEYPKCFFNRKYIDSFRVQFPQNSVEGRWWDFHGTWSMMAPKPPFGSGVARHLSRQCHRIRYVMWEPQRTIHDAKIAICMLQRNRNTYILQNPEIASWLYL